jgi:rubrerythrin
MKPSLVLPILATLIGFGLGWLVKPAPSPSGAATPSRAATASASPAGVAQNPNPAPAMPARPVRAAAAKGSAATAPGGAEEFTDPKDAAKMLRLVEALGLSEAQQADLKKIIAESRKSLVAGETGLPAGSPDLLTLQSSSGEALETALAALLTPEQSSAFAELRKRERDNRIEVRAQRELGQLLEMTDLSADQRAKVLGQLSESAATELASIPSSLALLLDSSMLPLGPQAVSEQTIRTLREIADAQDLSDPAAVHAKLIESQRRKLDERLKLLKDILTPAQVAQYQATIAEQHAIHDLINPPAK